ncbi:hypothetical protein DSECCO2_213050 [anaerobic digester metagenome]
MTPLAISAEDLGISSDRNLELSFISGVIQLEIKNEYGGHVSRTHIIRAVLSSPYLRTETERAYIIATLCEALPTGGYAMMLLKFKHYWQFVEEHMPDASVEERMADYCSTSRELLNLFGRGSA